MRRPLEASAMCRIIMWSVASHARTASQAPQGARH
jgi:hypothetical protein